ncbi:MAG: response regulator transcription factor [Dehalococcoidia bacterium]|nr:response regulator transcription factor [Dehalococcoidia bacterium]
MCYTWHTPPRSGRLWRRAMHQDLSPQERRVVAAVAEGKTNKQIALELGFAEPTVKNYVANAMHKADVDNRTLLALWWRQHEQAANG